MDRLPGARIAFIGDGPYRWELEEMLPGMPAVFTETLQGEELSQAYASGDVFVMPSESETVGFVVLEAMSSGVPVVAARASGIPDIIPPDQDGTISLLFTPGDYDAFMSGNHSRKFQNASYLTTRRVSSPSTYLSVVNK